MVSPLDITIRKYSDADYAKVCQLFRDGMLFYPSTYSAIAPRREGWERYVDMSLKDDLSAIPQVYDIRQDESKPGIGCFWVAVDAESSLWGMVGFQARPDLGPSKTGELRRMSVHHSKHRNGLGKRLIQQLEGWARSHGFETIALSTLASMQPAMSLYSSLGYQVVRKARLVPSEPGQPPKQEEFRDGEPEETKHMVVVYFEKHIAADSAGASGDVEG